jgi:SWI/SNF-related matrix-associated actin-dependent regulator of chromatin subfamily A-like protein 1
MILDYEPSNGNYIIRAPIGEKHRMVEEYGLDFWPAASDAKTGVFSTISPYAAAPFWEYAAGRTLEDPRLRWITAEIEASRAPDSDGHYDVPDDKELSGYQKADLAYMLRRGGKVLDADEPGLGKTMTAIAYANEVRAKRVLIVCPAPIRYQWLERWRDWSTMGRYLPSGAPLAGEAILSSRHGVGDAAVTTVSFQLAAMPNVSAALMQREYDLLIVDEAHYIKTQSTARAKAIFGGKLMGKDADGRRYLKADYGVGLAGRAQHVVELSGTPLLNRPAEAYVHAANLCPDSIDYASEHAFKERFNPVEIKQVRVWDAEAGVHLWKQFRDEKSGRHAELQSRLRAHFMCRHLKREVLTQLKLPRYDLVRAEETTLVKAALKAERLLDIDPETLTGEHADVMGHIAEARRLMGVALAPQAIEYAEMLLTSVEKLVVFYWHIEVGDILAKGLARYGVCRIDGRATPLVREAQKQRFLTDPNYRVMEGNVLSLGTGTDGLQDVASYCLIAEPDWVPGNNVQCVDRLDRRGQQQTVNADILVAPGSIAERVLALALRKGLVIHNALDRRVA